MDWRATTEDERAKAQAVKDAATRYHAVLGSPWVTPAQEAQLPKLRADLERAIDALRPKIRRVA